MPKMSIDYLLSSQVLLLWLSYHCKYVDMCRQCAMYVYTNVCEFYFSEDSHAPGYHAVPCHAVHDVEGGLEE